MTVLGATLAAVHPWPVLSGPATMSHSQPWVEAMRKPSKAGGEPAKMRRRKAVTAKHRKEPKSARRRSLPAADQVARLTRELNEALEQQTAVSEVLRVMSQSDFELQSTLHGVAQTAARLCRSDGAVIFQLEDGVYRFAGGYSISPAFLEIERQSFLPGREQSLVVPP